MTYGTDAMAGVWNFISRDEFEGLEIQTNSAFVQESDGGDQNFGIIWGTANDSANLVVSFEYENRDRLNVHQHGQVDHRFGNWPLGVSSLVTQEPLRLLTTIRLIRWSTLSAERVGDLMEAQLSLDKLMLGVDVAIATCLLQTSSIHRRG